MPDPDRPSRKNKHKDTKERRAPKGRSGPWRWLRGLLVRPVVLERRGLQWHVVLGERRQDGRRAARRATPTLDDLSQELRARLLSQDTEHAARVMRHLVFVHDELSRKGWRGVELLPAPVLAKALVQAQMLATSESSPALVHVIDRLQQVHIAAELREERRAQLLADVPARVEVSEATHEEFELTERSWIGVVPAEGPPSQPAQDAAEPAPPGAAQ